MTEYKFKESIAIYFNDISKHVNMLMLSLDLLEKEK